MVHIGRYTAALLLIATGVALVLDQTTGSRYLASLIDWWPSIFIILGIETILLSMVFRSRDAKLRFSFSSVFGAALITIVVLLFTNFGESKFGENGWRFWENGFEQVAMPVQHVALSERTEQIRVRNTNGKVEIRSGQVEQVTIEPVVHYLKFLNDNAAQEVLQQSSVRITEGETLEIVSEGYRYRHLLWKLRARMDLVITIPDAQKVDVHLELSNGSVTASNMQMKEQLTIRTSNGNIQVANVQGGLNLTTRNGDIEVKDVTSISIMRTNNGDVLIENVSASVDATTNNGDVEVRGTASDLYLKTNNGEIVVESDAVNGNWQLETNNGDISLALPEQGDFRIRGRGKVDTSLDWLEVQRRSVEGQKGSGQYLIEVETQNGEIVIQHFLRP